MSSKTRLKKIVSLENFNFPLLEIVSKSFLQEVNEIKNIKIKVVYI